MDTISILIGLAVILCLFFKGCGAIGWLHAEFEELLGYLLWGVVIFVVIFCWFL